MTLNQVRMLHFLDNLDFSDYPLPCTFTSMMFLFNDLDRCLLSGDIEVSAKSDFAEWTFSYDSTQYIVSYYSITTPLLI